MRTKIPLLQKKEAWLLILWVIFLLSAPLAYGQEQPGSKPLQNTGVQEDVNEFLGYEDLLLVRYISLPYDSVMNTNMAAYFVDLGFMLIIFLPLIFLFNARVSWPYRWGLMLLCIVFLLLSVPSAYMNKGQIPIENIEVSLAAESSSYTLEESPLMYLTYQLKQPFVRIYKGLYPLLSKVTGTRDKITYPVLFLLLPLLVFLLGTRIKEHELGLRTLLHFLLIFSFLWLLLSSGIPWYGLLMFPLFYLFIVLGLVGATPSTSPQWKTKKGLLLVAAAIWTITAFAYRFSNYEPTSENRARFLFNSAIAEYQIGRKDQTNVFDRTFPQYRTALQVINQEDKSQVYRVGTLMPFFIEKNDQRVLTDNFLDFFQSLNNEFSNSQELALALKAYGFRYLIIDLNLPVNDHTQEGSLRQKFENFMNFVYLNPQLQLIATDRIIRAADGNLRFQVFPENNPVEYGGWFAVYQII